MSEIALPKIDRSIVSQGVDSITKLEQIDV